MAGGIRRAATGRVHNTRVFVFVGTLLLGAFAACGRGLDDDSTQMLRWPLTAHCSIDVSGKGTKDLEDDYLPHVVTCENGGASLEALKVQAVSARTFAYYKIATAGYVKDGTSDQVYSCGAQPPQKAIDAVKATAGQVLVWSNVVICAFFVAGAKPSTQNCVALGSDPDPTGTEKFVTYNAGKTGSDIEQTTLGWVSPTNKYNRGCMSQNGSDCQAVKGKGYKEILRFYYGDDIQIETATGPCVSEPPPPPPPPPKPDSSVAKHDSRLKPQPDGGSGGSAGNEGGEPEESDGGPSRRRYGTPGPGTLAGSCQFAAAAPPSGLESCAALLLVLISLLLRRSKRVD